MLFLTIVISRVVVAGENVAPNGDLIDGAGTEASDWRGVSQRYLKPDQVADTFQRTHQPGGSSELRLTTARRGLIRWERTVRLAPGLYHLTGEIQEKDLTPNVDTATIGVELDENTFGMSETSQTQPSEWKTGGLYLKIGKSDRRIDITCKLVGRGSVGCRRILLVKADQPPPADTNIIDVDQYPEKENRRIKPRPYNPPSGQIWTLFVTIIALLAIATSGWMVLGPRRD
jgi:hypothetical protein